MKLFIDTKFNIGQKVKIRYNNAWRIGIITKITIDVTNKKLYKWFFFKKIYFPKYTIELTDKLIKISVVYGEGYIFKYIPKK